MKVNLARIGTAALLLLALVGCGGGSDPVPPPDNPPPATGPNVSEAIAAASKDAANDTATNSASAFSVLQGAGVPAVTVASPPKVNFTVFSDGAVKTGLTTSNARLAIAKLVPGTNGEPDQWVNYVYRTETATSGVGPNGAPALASAKQATSDSGGQLAYNEAGYYTYTFATDIKDPAKTNGVTFEPGLTHRIAIQLSYTNAAGETVRVNPYYDVTFDDSGNSVAVTDPAKTRKMADVATCNGCHDKLALHGGGRVDVQYCVMCHNPGTTDANSGNVLTMNTMVHSIHSGRELHKKGVDYVIWGNRDSKHDYSEVGFPQPTRNCKACHDGSVATTPQGDNWKHRPSKEACLTCHLSGSGSDFEATHITTLKLAGSVATLSNSACVNCHSATSTFAPEKVHWVQEMENAALYEGRIESVKVKTAPTATAAGELEVKVAVVNPATGTAYDLAEGCAKDATGKATCNTNYRWDVTGGAPQDKFGTFAVYAGSETIAGITVDDTTATANRAAYLGVNDGANHYTVVVPVAMGSKGNVRVMMTGSVAERRLDPVTRQPVAASVPPDPMDYAYVPVKNALMDFDLSTGRATAAGVTRRPIVSNDNCNACHGILGLPTHLGSPGFHKGVRNNADGCAVCHNANQASSYTYMTDGSTAPVAGDSQDAANTTSRLHESYAAKRFVHGIHSGGKRTFPFTHGDVDFSEVTYPGQLANCSNCHVGDSWKRDRSVLGSVVFKPTGTTMLDWYVISPMAATCTTCHDGKAMTQTHVPFGGGTFGQHTQNDLLFRGQVFEACEGCHAPGSALGVDVVHGLR